MTASEAATYKTVQRLAEQAWPRWVITWGWWSRRIFAFAAFLPESYVLANTDPYELAAAMHAVEAAASAAAPTPGGTTSASADIAPSGPVNAGPAHPKNPDRQEAST